MTITNDKGRLSKNDIERMVAEAERYNSKMRLLERRSKLRKVFKAMLST